MTVDTLAKGTIGSRGDARANRCRLCGGPAAFALRAPDPTRGSERTFDYEACRDCGCLQIAVVPPDLERFYGDDYYTTRSRLAPPARAGGWLGVRRLASRARLALSSGAFARLVSGRRYGRFEWFRRTQTTLDAAVLDVGCGSGRLLSRMRRDGFTRLTGIDPRLSNDVVEAARGLDGIALRRCTAADLDDAHHLVMAHHSFEHAEDPLAAWQALIARIAPGGWLLLRVPLADSWAASHDGADWAQLDAPRHLQIPTRRSLERLAARSGLIVAHVEDDSGPFQISGNRREASRPKRVRLVRAFRARWRARALRRAARGDQAVFYLHRADEGLT